MRKLKEYLFIAMFCSIVLVIVLLLVMAQPYFEARAFNRATGKNVSMWDAMFVDLRVQDGAK